MTPRFWSVFLLCPIVAACATAGRQYYEPSYEALDVLDEPVIQASDAILSEEAIGRLLASRIVLPEKAKLAVVNLGHRNLSSYAGGYYYDYGSDSAEFLQDQREYLDAIETPLWETGRFTEITYVPSLLLPGTVTLVRMREAAALMQAHLLLAYRSDSQLITDARAFVKDEIHAHASIEILLMDVKTGAIPYAETHEATHVEKEKRQDADNFETRKRADKAVTLKVLHEAVEGVEAFLRK